jgi:hypothetical protein
MHEEIKGRPNSENACYHSVQSVFSSRLLSRNVNVKTDKTMMLPGVLYGCETLSLTLRELHRLRVFESRAVRRIFGPKWDEVTGKWRKLHSEELYNLHKFRNIIRQIELRRVRWVGRVTRMGEERKFQLLKDTNHSHYSKVRN